MDPGNTKPRKRADWTRVFFALFLTRRYPPAPPSSVANKMDGLPSFFFGSKKREVFVDLVGIQSFPQGVKNKTKTIKGVINKATSKTGPQDASPIHWGGGKKRIPGSRVRPVTIKNAIPYNNNGVFLRHYVFKFITAKCRAVAPKSSWRFILMSFTSQSACIQVARPFAASDTDR